MNNNNDNNNNNNIIKARYIQFIINGKEKYDMLLEIIKNIKCCDYYISYFKEDHTAENKYIYMCVYFNRSYKIPKKMFELGIFIGKCCGYFKDNINYIKKENTIDVYGVCPKQKRCKGIIKLTEDKELEKIDELNKISGIIDRQFQFIINDMEKYNELIKFITNNKTCDYYISCIKKDSTTENKHIYMYAYFNNTYKIPKKILKLDIHIKTCRNSPKQYIDNIKNNGNILNEWGKYPKQFTNIKQITKAENLNADDNNSLYKNNHVQFIINDMKKYNKLLEIIKRNKYCDYYISCLKEDSTSKHIYMYAHFNISLYMSNKILDLGIDIKNCKNSLKQYIEYIENNGNILEEWGKRPYRLIKIIEESQKSNTDETINNEYNISDDSQDELSINEYNTSEDSQDELNNDMNIDDIYKEIKVYYIFSSSITGKTKKAYKIVKENEEKYGKLVNRVKYENDCWKGVGETAKIAIYDNFNDNSIPLDKFIDFIDYNIHAMNLKDGYKQNKYELIIITSIQNPKDIYKNYSENNRLRILELITEIIDLTPKEAN